MAVDTLRPAEARRTRAPLLGPTMSRRARSRLLTAPWQPLIVLADVAVLGMATLVLPVGAGAALAATVLLLLAARDCYQPRFTAQLGAVVGRLVTSVAVAVVGLTWLFDSAADSALLTVAPFVAGALVVGRAIAGAAIRAARRNTTGEPTLVVGAGGVGARMAANLLDHPEYGLSPVGIVDDIEDERLVLPLLGNVDELAAITRHFDVRHVVVAFGRASEERMVEVLRTCQQLDATVWVVPRLFELGLDIPGGDELWGIPVVELHRRALRSSQWRLKRAFDMTVALALLVLLAPIMAIVALAVKLTSRGPVLFRQHRIGHEGRSIHVLKFRTMHLNDDSNETWNVTSDPRVTPVGRVLRPTSLDELPQLINVFRGDMSLVGPRPERPYFVEMFSGSVPGYNHRHRVPVGLTGLSQVNGLRGDTSIADRATFDNRYIDNWSLWSDLVILFRTVVAIVRPPRSVQVESPGDVAETADVVDVDAAAEIDLRDASDPSVRVHPVPDDH